jgi:hypothetical protein
MPSVSVASIALPLADANLTFFHHLHLLHCRGVEKRDLDLTIHFDDERRRDDDLVAHPSPGVRIESRSAHGR